MRRARLGSGYDVTGRVTDANPSRSMTRPCRSRHRPSGEHTRAHKHTHIQAYIYPWQRAQRGGGSVSAAWQPCLYLKSFYPLSSIYRKLRSARASNESSSFSSRATSIYIYSSILSSFSSFFLASFTLYSLPLSRFSSVARCSPFLFVIDMCCSP